MSTSALHDVRAQLRKVLQNFSNSLVYQLNWQDSCNLSVRYEPTCHPKET